MIKTTLRICVGLTSFYCAGVFILPFPDIASSESLKDLSVHESEAVTDALETRIEALKKALAEAELQRTSIDPAKMEPRMHARGKDEQLTPRIVNGVVTAAYPSTGAMLFGSSAENAVFHCTGTLIGCSSFLTAAHCVAPNPDPSQYKVYFQHAGIYDVREVFFQKDKYKYPQGDIAILKLNKPVSGIGASSINSIRPVLFETLGTIVGFGRSGGLREDYGIKQIGNVKTVDCRKGLSSNLSNDKFLCWEFNAPVGNPGENSNTCNGDSGGPLFVDSGGQPVVAGTTVTGKNSACLTYDYSYDTAVTAHSKWIKDTCDQDLKASCGNLPIVGSQLVSVKARMGVLNSATQELSFELDVPVGIELLRIAMNGEDDIQQNIDFDLFVRQGDPGSAIICSRTGSSQFAFCEFETPTPGAWQIMVKRKQGAGQFQVVASLFKKSAP